MSQLEDDLAEFDMFEDTSGLESEDFDFYLYWFDDACFKSRNF
jgi:hypothetical protein